MTSSQEPPLTRREARERERLLQEQQAASATAGATADSVSEPTPTAEPRPAARPASAPPANAAPRPAGASTTEDASPSPFAPPAPAESFAPRPPVVAPASFNAPAERPGETDWEAAAPERTLTRRELRAMLDATADDYDDFDDDEPAAAGAAEAPITVAGGAPVQAVPPSPAPVRAPAPHQVTDTAIADEPFVVPKPVGHWTAQLNTPVDRAEPFDQLLSRGGVSHGVPTTTNALILPTLPDHGPMSDSFAKSGDVIITGSVDLPRSFGATGVHPSQIDSSDVDRLFDQVEDGAGVGAPIAATRAISTQSAARAMMAPPKKEGMNVPLVLAVTAGVLALGVVATLVIGAVAGLF